MNLMIKPASGHCNINCKYCFYKHGHTDNKLMDADHASQLIKKAENYIRGGFPLVFQGGEPLCAGYDFFVEALRTAKTIEPNAEIYVQTNATLIDDRFASLFARNGVLVGVSLDGCRETHDLYREDFDGVMRGIELLRSHGCEFNILTVVTDKLAERIKDVYAFYKEQDFRFQQYIPCIGGTYLSSEAYGRFLCDLYDLWSADLRSGRYVYIRLFENFLMLIAGMPAGECGANGICSPQFLIESDGSVYPCDFYVDDDHLLGNISEGFDTLEKRLLQSEFIPSSVALPNKCASCRYRDICRGGCRRYRAQDGGFLFCEAYKMFFDYALEDLKKILAEFGDQSYK